MGRSILETWIWGGKRQRREAAKLLPEQQPASNEHSVLPKEGKQEVDLGVTGWQNKEHDRFHNGKQQVEERGDQVSNICGPGHSIGPQAGDGGDQNKAQEDTQRGAEQKIRHGKTDR